MLAILETRLTQETSDVGARVEVVRADMRELELERQFDLAIVPYFTFNYLMSLADQRIALARLHRHLAPKAYLLVDVFIPYRRIEDCPSEPVVVVDKIDPATENHVRGLVTFAIDTERQIESRRHVFETTGEDGTVGESVFDTARRYSLPQELRDLFPRSGFRVEAELTGYGRLAEPRSEQLVYVLRRR